MTSNQRLAVFSIHFQLYPHLFLLPQLLPVDRRAARHVELRDRVAAAFLARRALGPAAARWIGLRVRPQDGPPGRRVQAVQARPGEIGPRKGRVHARSDTVLLVQGDSGG